MLLHQLLPLSFLQPTLSPVGQLLGYPGIAASLVLYEPYNQLMVEFYGT